MLAFVAAPNSALAAAADLELVKTDKPVTPGGVYHHVWQLVKDHYYDPTYNGQNWTRWEHRYDKQLTDLDDARRAINTMVMSLADRYTRYLDPTAFDSEKEAIAAKLYGVGIQMNLNKEHKLIVISPIEGSPAAKAGILPMDEIAEIDSKPTSGLSVEQASKMIRGPIGTTVVLTILRTKERKLVSITRDEIPIRSVHNVQMLNNEMGYIRLGTFMSERANEEMRVALDKLSPARGLVIDLRNNPGGLVNNAIDICGMFLESNPSSSPIVVSTIDRNAKVQAFRASSRQISKQALVVLINEGSASASEITSGALHDSKRADLVGQKSFGKGLVQSITRLEDGGGLNTTIARYLTPDNIDINKKGITPDFSIELKSDDYQNGRGPWFVYGRDDKGVERLVTDGKDVQLKKAMEVLKNKLDYAIAPKVELRLTPFSNTGNPFPNAWTPENLTQ